jgi:hypothetical protein
MPHLQTFPFGLKLACTLAHEIVGGRSSAMKEAVPRGFGRRNNPLATGDPHFNLFDGVREAHVCRQADCLGSVVIENGADSHISSCPAIYIDYIHVASCSQIRLYHGNEFSFQQAAEKRYEQSRDKEKRREAVLAGMGRFLPNSQKAEFTQSLSLRDPAF